MDLMEIKKLNEIESVGSRLAKQKILATVDDKTINFLSWALDPMITFGVTVDVKSIKREGQTVTDFWPSFDVLLAELSTRHLTGNAALDRMNELLRAAPSDDDVKWACRIINKDLRAGLQLSTLLNVFPGVIEPFACSLAKPYDAEKHEIRGRWSVEPKLDGLRMVVIDGVAYTRNGRTIDTVGHILEELAPLGSNYVFDGEIMGVTDFNQDSGKIRKKGVGANKDLVYNVFDCIWKDEWDKKKTQSYEKRREYLFEALGTAQPNFSRIVESKVFLNPTTEELFAARDFFIDIGYEGAMLKDMQAPYYFERSNAILKLKTVKDADGRIVSAYEGKNRHTGRLGGFVTEFDGVETRVGGGFSDAQRDQLWRNVESHYGKMIEVEYQEKSPDGSLRFPVFVKFRPDRD